MKIDDADDIVLRAYRSSYYHMKERVNRWHLSEDIIELQRCKKELARVEAEISARTGKGAERRTQEKPQEAAQRKSRAEDWIMLSSLLNFR